MPVTRPGSRSALLARAFSRIGIAAALVLGFQVALAATSHQRTRAQDALSDAEFWELFTSMSEPGGSFVSENFVSNEISFQEVIPAMQRSLTKNGVYLGVGPEQNFTYIANLKPRLAVIFDIRRQNAMQHLLYKAIFEQSPTRADFIERLFARPFARPAAVAPTTQLFDSAGAAPPSDSAYRANLDGIVRTLTATHGFALSSEDLAAITYLYKVFVEAGPGINYAYRPGMPATVRNMYPTFAMLQSATNADSVPMAFLSSEELYREVRDMHLRNLIVPVVGDFAGPKAIRAVGDYLRKHGLTVTAFYLSNVEQYLFRQSDAAARFYSNVSSLPTDSTSTFVRSIPRNDGMVMNFSALGTGFPPGNVSVGGMPVGSFTRISIQDSGGVRVTQVTQDSAGVPITRVTRDSAGVTTNRVIRDSTVMPARRTFADSSLRIVPGRPDSTLAFSVRRDSVFALAGRADSVLRRLLSAGVAGGPRGYSIMRGGLLTSGLASISGTLDAFFAGKVNTYQDVIAMTKTSGWK